MKTLEFYATKEQGRELSGLAYWIADINYLRERYGNSDPEIETADKTILLCFDRLDALGVPFWVQNAVIVWAGNWRNYIQYYLADEMKKKQIYI